MYFYFPVYVRIHGVIYVVLGKLCNASRKNGEFLAEKNSLPGRENEKVDKTSC